MTLHHCQGLHHCQEAKNGGMNENELMKLLSTAFESPQTFGPPQPTVAPLKSFFGAESKPSPLLTFEKHPPRKMMLGGAPESASARAGARLVPPPPHPTPRRPQQAPQTGICISNYVPLVPIHPFWWQYPAPFPHRKPLHACPTPPAPSQTPRPWGKGTGARVSLSAPPKCATNARSMSH